MSFLFGGPSICYLPRFASLLCADSVAVSSYLYYADQSLDCEIADRSKCVCKVLALPLPASARQVSGPCRSRFKLLRSRSHESLASEGLEMRGCRRSCSDIASRCIHNLEWLAGQTLEWLAGQTWPPAVAASIGLLESLGHLLR